jgi:hypothetical protein
MGGRAAESNPLFDQATLAEWLEHRAKNLHQRHAELVSASTFPSFRQLESLALLWTLKQV